MWSGHVAIRSTGPDQEILKVSWTGSASPTLRGSTRLGTVINYKVLHIRSSRCSKRLITKKKLEDPKGDFPEAHKEVNYIYSGPDSYEPKRNQKLTAQEVMAVSPTTLEYLKWFEVLITFDRDDHPDFIP
jgi:hypothetical protein